jgi:hypothetical protein
MANPNLQVAEMQGLYGPFTLTERVVQKIWLRGDFARHRLALTDGRPLEIRFTGKWNLLGGPDFHAARLVIDGGPVTADVEVHFHSADWRAHAHAADRAYDNVGLHVVLFPPGAGEKPAVHRDGREIPTLVLLPHLHRDLEEYASDDALEVITSRDEWEKFAELAALPAPEMRPLLLGHAGDRWRQKVRFARLRLARLGWTDAAHHTALEIFGYRQNRAAMLRIAAQCPLKSWAEGVNPEEVFAEGGLTWQLQGVRPANHPLTRLRQYQRWVTAQPDWPEQLRTMKLDWSRGHPAAESTPAAAGSPPLPGITAQSPTKAARQALGLKKLREAFARDIMGGVVGGSRLDNLVCDGFLPLVAAETGDDPFAVWFHWFLGDVPAPVRKIMPKLGLAGPPGQPLCHGWAQGLLGWILEREARASR